MEKQQMDYTGAGREREFAIGELIREILRRFWLVVVAAVICAVVAGGYSYMKTGRDVAAEDPAAGAEGLSDIELTEEEMTEVNNVLYVQTNLDEQQQYVDNSILMQINAYDESRVVMQYYVTTANDEDLQEYGKDLLRLYKGYIDNGSLASALAEDGYGLQLQYLTELISSSSEIVTDTTYVDDAEYTSISTLILKVVVIHENQEAAEELADRIENCLVAYGETLDDSVAANDLTLVSRATARTVDSSLSTYKLDCVREITSLQSQIDSLKEDLTDDQLAMLEYYTADQTVAETTETQTDAETETEAGGISGRSVGLGAIVGIVLACLYIVACYCLRGTVNTFGELRSLYRLRILGEVEEDTKKNVLVRLWDRLAGRGRAALTPEQQKELLLVNLKNACHEKTVKKVLLGGTAGIEADWSVIDDIVRVLAEQGVTAVYAPDLVYSVETVDTLAEYDAVILVEKIRDSRCEMVEAKIRTCCEHDVQILGVVAFA